MVLCIPISETFAQTATIVSQDTSLCEAGVAYLKVRFEGEAPFGIVYQVGTSINAPLDKPIYAESLVDGVGTISLGNITNSSEVTLIQVFDNTISGDKWVYGQGNLNNGSTDVYGSMTVTVDQMPSPNAGTFDPHCGYEAQLNASLSMENTSMFWSDVTNGAFDDITNPNAVFTAEASGTYTLTLTEVNGTCEATSDVEVELLGSPQSVLTGVQNICSNKPDDLPKTLSVTTEISNGTAPYTYTLSNGIDPDIVRYNISNTEPDQFGIEVNTISTYEVISIIDDNNCTAHADSIVGTAVVTDDKPNANAGLNDTWCESDLTNGYTLSAILDKAEGGVWLDTEGITFSDNSSPESTVQASSYGTHTLTWQETYNGCSETSIVNINFVNPPSLNLLKGDTAICEGSDATLRVLSSSEYYPLQFTYSNASEFTSSLDIDYNEIIVSPNSLGVNTYNLLSLTDTEGCITTLSDQFDVNVSYIPEPMPGDYVATCGNTITLDAILGSEENGMWSSDIGVFSNANSPTSTYSLDFTDSNIQEVSNLQWRVENINNTNCVDSVTVALTFDQAPSNVFAGNDTTIYHENSLDLSPTGTIGDMVGIWESIPSSVSFSQNSDLTYTASNLQEGINQLIWSVSNGACEAQENAVNVVFKPLTNPNGFSPNGDGINDLFYIGGADKIANNKLVIFDLNGKVVFEKNNFGTEGWNGIGMDGESLRNGTYYYVFNGDNVTIKDYLIIKETY